MRTWVKVTIGGVVLIVVAFAALAGTSAYFVMRHMDERTGTETDASQAIDAVRARFGQRPPLIEIGDPRSGDIRIQRPAEASATPVDTVHVLNWKREANELTSADLPLWLMRFSTVNLASRLGIAPAKFRLTVADIERYGPGVVADYASPGAFRVFIWVD